MNRNIKRKWALSAVVIASGLLLAGCQQSSSGTQLSVFPPADYGTMSYHQKMDFTQTYINTFYSIASPTKVEREDYHKAMTALSQLQNTQYKPETISTNSPDCQYIALGVYPPVNYTSLTEDKQIALTKHFINQFYRIEKPTQSQYEQYRVAVSNLSKMYNAQYLGSLALTEQGKYQYINLPVYPPKDINALTEKQQVAAAKKYINDFYELQAPTEKQMTTYHLAIHNLSNLYNKQY